MFISAVAALLVVVAAGSTAADSGSSELFVRSAVEHADGTATFPLQPGTSQGRTVYYLLLLDSSDGNRASALGLNRSQKLANAASTGAVQHVGVKPGSSTSRPAWTSAATGSSMRRTALHRPASSRARSPRTATARSSSARDGTIDNAPQIAHDQNGDGRIDPGTETADKGQSSSTPRTSR